MTRQQIDIIKAALDQPENLSEWEYEYVSDLANKENFEELTDRQARTLEKIETKLDY